MVRGALIRGLLAHVAYAIGNSLVRLADRLGEDSAQNEISTDPLAMLRLKFPSAPDHWLQAIADRAPHLAAEPGVTSRTSAPAAPPKPARQVETKPYRARLHRRPLFGKPLAPEQPTTLATAPPFEGAKTPTASVDRKPLFEQSTKAESATNIAPPPARFQRSPAKRNLRPTFTSPPPASPPQAVVADRALPPRKRASINFTPVLETPDERSQAVDAIARSSAPRGSSAFFTAQRDQIASTRSIDTPPRKEADRGARQTSATAPPQARPRDPIFSPSDKGRMPLRRMLEDFTDTQDARALWAELPYVSAEPDLAHRTTQFADERRRIEDLTRDQTERLWNG